MNFEKHVFICSNSREKDPQSSCGPKGGLEIQKLFKKKLEEKGLKGKVRANQAGCLGACQYGVTMVIYPQGIWYKTITIEDIDEIIEKSIIGNEVITRLHLEL